FEDRENGKKYAQTKLQMPVLAIGASEVYGNSVEHYLKQGALNVQGVVVPNSGHFIPEEKPEELIQLLLKFAAS
ncbi:MAG: alpha/beta hydrolase, partial [Cyanobacteriota bacterium]|nr:alpha/beta hydrolase [Cyanobacteriota bacterium]